MDSATVQPPYATGEWALHVRPLNTLDITRKGKLREAVAYSVCWPSPVLGTAFALLKIALFALPARCGLARPMPDASSVACTIAARFWQCVLVFSRGCPAM